MKVYEFASAIAFVNARGRAWKLVREQAGAEQHHETKDEQRAGGQGADRRFAPGDGAQDADAALSPDRRTPLDIATVVAFALHTASGLLYLGLMLLGRQYF